MNQYVTGAVIKRLREEKNMTQQQLADKLSVSAKTISKWETAKGYPDITLLESIANALSVSVTELISGNTIVTLSAFEWEKDRKTLIYGQVDYMYGEALYKPEMKAGNPIRLYSLDEITEIFGKLGLRICNSFADFSGKLSSDNDIQLMVYSIRE
ncbi:helix-turn-helix domain-containing protein [Lachnospira hominis (ex Liu et al. 2021)]|uniref:Helix-turn-helix transcriptional regulator n=1 Tax=Lachnospira hominis (ex Liu et al. 2021) TaxID=2763051 RepID=A0ABR7FYV2_9FIRM|nr:helix-turn-helix transcriptional regulator [Lachnospira hominis]MBC5680375.1 helix-turn-helix transcriptional regulator [Lachnospira hominis]